MYVIILPATSLNLPCQLTGGTSCPTMICPNTAVNYTCNVGSYAGNTVWNVPSVGECSGSPLSLAQAPPGPGLSCLTISSSGTCGPFTVTNTPPLTSNGYCLTSTLSVVVTSAMNALVVTCSNYSTISFAITPVGNTTISVVGMLCNIHEYIFFSLMCILVYRLVPITIKIQVVPSRLINPTVALV